MMMQEAEEEEEKQKKDSEKMKREPKYGFARTSTPTRLIFTIFRVRASSKLQAHHQQAVCVCVCVPARGALIQRPRGCTACGEPGCGSAI
jgi:hypothetical protein